MIKNIYKKPTTIIILNGEVLNAFPLRSGRKGCPISLLLLHTVLEVLPLQSIKKKKILCIQIAKEEEKLFADNMIL